MQLTGIIVKAINGTDQLVYFSLTDDDGRTYKWYGFTPILAGQALQSWLDSHQAVVYCGLLRIMFPEARIEPDLTSDPPEALIQAWRRWIVGGRINPATFTRDKDGNPKDLFMAEKVIDILPMLVVTPAFDEAAMQADVDLDLPSWAQVSAAITAVGNLADAKAILAKLARIVYWLAKKSAT